MYLTDKERADHSELYDRLESEKKDRRDDLRRELLKLRRSGTQARTWRFLFLVVVAAAVVVVSQVADSPRDDLATIVSVGILAYAAVEAKVSELRTEAEAINLRLQQFDTTHEDLVYRLAIIDETATRLERFVRARKHA